MTGRAVVERAGALWNDHDGEGFIYWDGIEALDQLGQTPT